MLDLPEPFSADRETVRYLQQYKASLQRRFSLSRMEELFQAVDLGFYLAALQRPEEALEVVSFMTSKIEFGGNFNIWTPVGYGICLQARLLRLKGNRQAAQDIMERVRIHPFQVNETRGRVIGRIETLQPNIDEAFQKTSRKWSCHTLARTLYNVCFYQEATVHGFVPAGWVSVEALEVLMQNGFEKLAERLE